MDYQLYDSYFDFWLDHSDCICECCIYNDNFDCEDCESFYNLTEEECKEEGLDPDSPWAPSGWNCQNTDDFKFCEKIKNSPCRECINSFSYKNFSSNGKIK